MVIPGAKDLTVFPGQFTKKRKICKPWFQVIWHHVPSIPKKRHVVKQDKLIARITNFEGFPESQANKNCKKTLSLLYQTKKMTAIPAAGLVNKTSYQTPSNYFDSQKGILQNNGSFHLTAWNNNNNKKTTDWFMSSVKDAKDIRERKKRHANSIHIRTQKVSFLGQRRVLMS